MWSWRHGLQARADDCSLSCNESCPGGVDSCSECGPANAVIAVLTRLDCRPLHLSFTEAIKAVFPHARFQADHFHTVKNIWGHLKKALLSYRRQIKARGEAKNDQDCVELAKTLWKWRWSLLKKPTNLSAEEKQAIAELERRMKGLSTVSAALSGSW